MTVGSNREMDVAMGLGAPDDPVDISVILPAYNEQDSIEGIYKQIVGVLDRCDCSYEIMFVDDGSTDATWQEIQALAGRDRRVRALRHRRNYGKASALANGFTYARGNIMVTSDADMQYDPQDVLRLIEKVNEGYDVVSAYKVVRRDPWTKRFPSKFFNFFVRTTTGVPLHDINAGLKAYRYDAAQDMVRYGYGELHRFFIVLAARNGFSVTEVPVESCPRPNGHSKYGAERFVRGALDYVTVFFLSGYTERPLHLLGSAGMFLGGIGTVILAGLLALKLLSAQVSMAVIDPLIDVSALLILAGVQLVAVGLLAEMINNLERGSTNRSKISRVVRVDRRTSILLAPGVQVERRRGDERQPVEAVVVAERQDEAQPQEGVGVRAEGDSAERG
ncbi:MAG: glycosyltransferase family 2 protein [Coriobacteriales bacterium]|nr:glycosyltransferase family 2 protein [Coriobacteriales bacterium]